MCIDQHCTLLHLQVRLNGSTFTVWDVGGQDKLRPLWRSYTRCTDGIIFVVDSTKEERLEEAKLELQKICKSTVGSASAAGVRNKNSIPVLVLANMQVREGQKITKMRTVQVNYSTNPGYYQLTARDKWTHS